MQKTAYEVRISDWSSDVCSSDLGRRAGELVFGHEQRPQPHRMPGHELAGRLFAARHPAAQQRAARQVEGARQRDRKRVVASTSGLDRVTPGVRRLIHTNNMYEQTFI